MEIEDLKALVEITANYVLERAGLASQEIPASVAKARFGDLFNNALRSGKIKPSRVGRGKTPKKWFRVNDILEYRFEMVQKANIILNKYNENGSSIK